MYLPAFINIPLNLLVAKPKQTVTADWESLKKRNSAPDWFRDVKSVAGETPRLEGCEACGSQKGGFDAEQSPAAQRKRKVGRAGFEPT